VKRRIAELLKQFPRGLPATGNVGSQFILEDAISWVAKRLPVIPRPFLGYFHFLPPHGPYNTSLKFFNHFQGDGFRPLEKPEDIFSRKVPAASLLKQRLEYDEFILYVDEQFGRFFDSLEASGVLEDTWVFLTSDHGELHERGISGHSTYGLYEPVVRVPLLIFQPGRTTGQDVFTPTSAADILPTVMKLAGASAPDWSDGIILPPFAEPRTESQRGVYALQAEKTGMNEKITRASVILVKDRYKLLDYFGYEGSGTGEFLRLFDIQSDPDELNDLAATRPELVKELLDELKKKVAGVNKPYS
jgi:choline-sulfatase